jgi:NAD(P)-dependent dehydrogenase (short-subunit alcohol dehydrogenase family)
MNIQGRRVLITGGGTGIGLALARALARKGACLVVSGRRPGPLATAVAELTANGTEAHAVAADVATEAGRSAMLDAARYHLGGLDILVNNAGGVRAGRLETTTEDEIRTMIDVDLLAPILLTRAALPELRRSGHGLIVNVTSGGALIGMPFYATYVATKAGLARFGEALRRELKGEGVDVLTVFPGGTDTNNAGADLGFDREPAAAVGVAIVEGIENGQFDVMRGGESRMKLLALNREDPAALDERFLSMKKALEVAVRDHRAL